MGVGLVESTVVWQAVLIVLLAVIFSIIGTSWHEIVVHPESADVMEGSNITLRCKFSENIIKCTWYHDSADPADINDRYQYLDTNSKGRNTTDCSIIITDFKAIDAKRWQCSALLETDGIQWKMSNISLLTLVKYNELITTTTETPNETSIIFMSNTSITKTETPNETSINITPCPSNYHYMYITFAMTGLLMLVMLSLAVVCCHRKNKAKTKENPKSTLTKYDSELHDYTYITTIHEASEEDTVKLSVPQDSHKYANVSEVELLNEIYQEITEVTSCI